MRWYQKYILKNKKHYFDTFINKKQPYSQINSKQLSGCVASWINLV
jgi:hypothetical protein